MSHNIILYLQVPRLVCKQGSFRKFVAENVPMVHERFSPFVLTFGSSLQTIVGAVLKKEPVINWDEMEELDLPDKGQVHLHWMHNKQSNKHDEDTRPTVLLLPGLTGNNESNYICALAKILERTGYR